MKIRVCKNTISVKHVLNYLTVMMIVIKIYYQEDKMEVPSLDEYFLTKGVRS